MPKLTDLKSTPIFSKELPTDRIKGNKSRKVFDASFTFVKPKKTTQPELVHFSQDLADQLEVEIDPNDPDFTQIFSGNKQFKNSKPYAMCYGGHQFGNWAGQLGDGRAINIGEVNLAGENWKFQLKGAGPTPYSRGSDGLAVLRSSIREYLCSEAMFHLGVPTTRALSLVKTGDMVTRDMMYDNNPKDEQGAIVCRVSPSFIRFGNFELFSVRKDLNNLTKLADYTIKNHFPQIKTEGKEAYIEFIREVASKTKEMIVQWYKVGFVHGVMNTDNMSILGLTIDYGPYGWLEDYDPTWTPNTTDSEHRRYRFGNQATIALWNLTQLANAMFPLINEVEPLQEILNNYKQEYLSEYHNMMCQKVGLANMENVSADFFLDLEERLSTSELDMTLFYRGLSKANMNRFISFWDLVVDSSYLEEDVISKQKTNWRNWFETFQEMIANEGQDPLDRSRKMREVNPKYVLRNYMSQLAIDAAEGGDFSVIDELYQMLRKPYDEQPDMEKWYAKRPEWAKNKVGCSMLSCSS